MEPFKEFLNFKKAKRIAQSLKKAHPSFQEEAFLKELEKSIPPLELKQRMELIAHTMVMHLPKEPQKLFSILIRSAHELEGFLAWPHTHVVATQGHAHLELSLETLYQITHVFSGEFAIRDFLIREPEKTLKIMRTWTQDPSEHVRRLVSEGSRPLLPWGKKIESFVQDPCKTWDLLESLKNDPSIYVRKSVANHLNDHSKNHPEWVVRQLKDWQKTKTPEMDWIIRHGSRTLIKKGHVGALSLQGVKKANIQVVGLSLLPKKIKLGQTLLCQVTLKNLEKKAIKVILDQELGLRKKNGSLSMKVFKGKTLSLDSGSATKVSLKLPIRPVTTRTYYSGQHTYTLVLNGVKIKSQKFMLQV